MKHWLLEYPLNEKLQSRYIVTYPWKVSQNCSWGNSNSFRPKNPFVPLQILRKEVKKTQNNISFLLTKTVKINVYSFFMFHLFLIHFLCGYSHDDDTLLKSGGGEWMSKICFIKTKSILFIYFFVSFEKYLPKKIYSKNVHVRVNVCDCDCEWVCLRPPFCIPFLLHIFVRISSFPQTSFLQIYHYYYYFNTHKKRRRRKRKKRTDVIQNYYFFVFCRSFCVPLSSSDKTKGRRRRRTPAASAVCSSDASFNKRNFSFNVSNIDGQFLGFWITLSSGPWFAY